MSVDQWPSVLCLNSCPKCCTRPLCKLMDILTLCVCVCVCVCGGGGGGGGGGVNEAA